MHRLVRFNKVFKKKLLVFFLLNNLVFNEICSTFVSYENVLVYGFYNFIEEYSFKHVLTYSYKQVNKYRR